jgi:hypothetical protein
MSTSTNQDLEGPTTNAADQDRAAALRAAGQQVSGGSAAGALDAFPAVSVASGLYKYVLINASAPESGERKVLLRSGPGNYHGEHKLAWPWPQLQHWP